MTSKLEFISRRSPIVCTGGCVASSQPLATNIGLDILRKGGNAADAAVAVAAALNVTEPASTGIGGDCFCLFYKAKTKRVYGLNGSGRSPRALSIDLLKQQGFEEANPIPSTHAHNVTVPGAAAAWVDTVALFGSKKVLSESGKKGFYEGRIAEAVVQVVKSNGGVMELEDLASHVTEEVQPICTTYKGIRVWEIPPTGQGITALLALNVLENFNVKEMGHNSADYLHVLAEALKLSISDTMWYCADPCLVPVPTEELLNKAYSGRRAMLIDLQRVSDANTHGNPFETGSNTVYFTVVDSQGNACSFINSNYIHFGTGLVPEGCGFTLQNRGRGFSLSPGHPNCLAPGKRPFHTIIPALATTADTHDLLCSFGVMGGFMQPQGHVQVLFNMAEFGMNPQQALDAARFYVEYSKEDQKWQLYLEDGILKDAAEELKARGHDVQWPICGHDRKLFGRGQIITKGEWWRSWQIPINNRKVWWAGSDPRGDGCAMGY
ncbi:hypothetical protein FKM82_004020 [Ascaphus truei]